MPAPEFGPNLSTAAGFTRTRARALARDVGFSEAGLMALPYAEEARDAHRFEQWIGAGRAGAMHYLSRVAENGALVRARVGLPYPWARSAIVCFALYNAAQPLSTDAAPEGAAWIARYAWSSRTDADGKRVASDYHKVLLKRLKALDARLHDTFGEFESRAYVDTGPVVERSLAVAAGLGWTGKNTCLIHPQLGSFGFLAVLLTSLTVSEGAREQESEPASQQDSESASQEDSASASQQVSESARLRVSELANRRVSESAGHPIGRLPDEIEAAENLAPKGPPRIAQGGVRRSERNPGTRSPMIPPPRRGGTNSQNSSPPGDGFNRADQSAISPGASAPSQETRSVAGLVSGHDFSRANQSAINPGASAPADASFEIPDRCGTCTRCIEACPTNALDVPYQMDATKCIAYLTIEKKGPIEEELAARIGRQVFGCDICQDVCPWNKKALRRGFVARNPELEPRAELVNPTLDWLSSLDEQPFEKEFNGSPVRRAGFNGLRRNLAIAMGNSALERFRARLLEWSNAADEGLRTAARWALGKLDHAKAARKSEP
jgi:epoxyqueuosine reductase QueG